MSLSGCNRAEIFPHYEGTRGCLSHCIGLHGRMSHLSRVLSLFAPLFCSLSWQKFSNLSYEIRLSRLQGTSQELFSKKWESSLIPCFKEILRLLAFVMLSSPKYLPTNYAKIFRSARLPLIKDRGNVNICIFFGFLVGGEGRDMYISLPILTIDRRKGFRLDKYHIW